MKNNELLNKLNNLCEMLNECDVPAAVIPDAVDGEPILLGLLWNCRDSSAVRLEISRDPYADDEDAILAVANPLACTYDEALKNGWYKEEDEE